MGRHKNKIRTLKKLYCIDEESKLISEMYGKFKYKNESEFIIDLIKKHYYNNDNNYYEIKKIKDEIENIKKDILTKELKLIELNSKINDLEKIENKEFNKELSPTEKLRDGLKRLKDSSRSLAVNKIKIPQDKLCEICNINKAIERHHEDYTKPLEVKFLCKNCHEKL